MARAPMLTHTRFTRLASLAGILLAAAVWARPSTAQMTPIADERGLAAGVTYLEQFDADIKAPPTPFMFWNESVTAHVDNPDPDPNAVGYCEAGAWQISQFGPSYISASGGCGGGWDFYGGAYTATSKARFRFRVTTCVEYQLDVWLEPGDEPLGDYIRLRADPAGPIFYEVTDGELHINGRLAPGEYALEGLSTIATPEMYVDGSVYTVLWTAIPCSSPPPIIGGQPADAVINCGDNPSFSVTTSAPSPAYQWRRNLVPLTNDGHFAGVDGPTLSISNACDADTGYFDVVVMASGVSEPSRLAHLTLTPGAVGVEEELVGPIHSLSLLAAGPNPFAGTTSFRYALPHPARLRIAIHDAKGARVRTLLDSVVDGPGIVSWDGTTNLGTRVPPGIYFLHAEADGAQATRKVVLMR